MCVKILEAAGKINMDEYQFFLRGGIVSNHKKQLFSLEYIHFL
jgi:dynein heavy chain